MKSVSMPTYQFPGQTNFYSGKVRDVYYLGDLLVIVASDRISAFDHILPRPIPYYPRAGEFSHYCELRCRVEYRETAMGSMGSLGKVETSRMRKMMKLI